jgi:hypothetical protein
MYLPHLPTIHKTTFCFEWQKKIKNKAAQNRELIPNKPNVNPIYISLSPFYALFMPFCVEEGIYANALATI